MTPVLLALALQVATIDEASVRDLCSAENFAQVDFAACLKRKAAESEQALAAAIARATQRVNGWDDDPPYRAAAETALTASGAPFVRYRIAQCAFAASLSGGGAGNAREVRRLACVYELNMRRAAMLDGLTGKLPAR